MHDIRIALRQLRKSPGFALTVILTIALGIGANTAIFTLVHAVLLKSLPVADPKTLYRIGDKDDCCVNGGFMNDDGDFDLFSYDLVSPSSRHYARVRAARRHAVRRQHHDRAARLRACQVAAQPVRVGQFLYDLRHWPICRTHLVHGRRHARARLPPS